MSGWHGRRPFHEHYSSSRTILEQLHFGFDRHSIWTSPRKVCQCFSSYKILPFKSNFDDAPLESNSTAWHTIYCADGDICGYAISKPLDNRAHHIYHADKNATIFVHSYDFLAKKSYGIIGGMELQPFAGK